MNCPTSPDFCQRGIAAARAAECPLPSADPSIAAPSTRVDGVRLARWVIERSAETVAPGLASRAPLRGAAVERRLAY
ncbi:hypothetical protein WME75_39425 [Sorangium sp. So ce1014]|uniref:hypothetical protein n=1 Tax=Sorangium sp. So ce1014 TaxID=3133326 RepID=UPI003F5DF534